MDRSDRGGSRDATEFMFVLDRACWALRAKMAAR